MCLLFGNDAACSRLIIWSPKGGGGRWGVGGVWGWRRLEWARTLSLQDLRSRPCPPALLRLPDPLIDGLSGRRTGSAVSCHVKYTFLSFLPLELPVTIPSGLLKAHSLSAGRAGDCGETPESGLGHVSRPFWHYRHPLPQTLLHHSSRDP